MTRRTHWVIIGCVISLSFSLCSCSSNQSPVINEKEIISSGDTMANGMQEGVWTYKDKNGIVYETGKFDSGIRIGTWHYKVPLDTVLDWEEFRSEGGSIRTNMASGFIIREKYDSVVVIKYPDTSKVLTIVIGQLPTWKLNMDNYKKELYRDFQVKGLIIEDSLSQMLETVDGRKYQFYMVWVRTKQGKNVRLLNLISEINPDILLEVSVASEEALVPFGQVIFYSILPNLYIDSALLINGRDLLN